jgi:hypothetical protein
VAHASANEAELVQDIVFEPSEVPEDVRLAITKRFTFGPAPGGCEVACEVRLSYTVPPQKPFAIGIESVVNLLAPTESDRFFETLDGKQNLRFSGTVAGSSLRMQDGWQRLRIALHAPGAQHFWIAPIETVSESEEGFERVYQGSQILAVWYPPLSHEQEWKGTLVWRVERL